MPKIAVIYASQYGATERYARWIAQELGAEFFPRAQIKPENLAAYDLVIYGGAIYAGSIKGVDLVAKHPCPKLVLFTVGLSDPAHYDFSPILANAFGSPPPPSFHLRGGVNWQKLSFPHKAILSAISKMTAKRPPEELTPDMLAVMNVRGKTIDYTDRASIAPLVEYVRGQ